MWVDFLRGLAAFAVLVSHYQHFYFASADEPNLADPSVEPFYRQLHALYMHGAASVELFWVISGFVFASIYAETAAPVKAADFAVNRFARLYPLHFVTLIVIAALQFVSNSKFGHYQIYPYNDVYHFILNLGFASSWGLEQGFSYNGPIWSVSVEVLIYAAFFVSIPYISRRPMLTPVVALFFSLLLASGIPGKHVWQCGACFFLGCFAFKMWKTLDSSGARPPLLAGGVGALLAVLAHFLTAHMTAEHSAQITKLIAFPSLVLIAASFDRLDVFGLGSKVRVVGDLTYSTYLLHIPVQISTLIILESLGVDRAVVSSVWFFAGFLIVVFVISHFSFKYLETPSRVAIRDYMLKRKSGGQDRLLLRGGSKAA